MNLQYRLHILGNTLVLLSICTIILIVLKEEYIDVPHLLPCPLCFLQRAGYFIIGLCVCLNLTRGPSVINYATFILGCVFGIGISTRHLFLHILPGDSGYGCPIAGLFAYTWNIIIFSVFLIFGALSLYFYKGFEFLNHKYTILSKVLVSIFVVILIINFISAVKLCGFGSCPEDPNEINISKNTPVENTSLQETNTKNVSLNESSTK